MKFVDYETEPIKCVGCGEPMDGHLSTRKNQPEPKEGDLAICSECSTMCVYVEVDGKMAFRHPTDDEMKEFLSDPRVLQCIALVTTARLNANLRGNR